MQGPTSPPITATPERGAALRELGAAAVASCRDVADQQARFDIVLESAGGASLARGPWTGFGRAAR